MRESPWISPLAGKDQMRRRLRSEIDAEPGYWRDLTFSAIRDDIAVSLVFLTRLPVSISDETFRARPLVVAMRAFPVAGAIVGAIGGLTFMGASELGLTAFVAAALALAVMALSTGAFHEDALADVADGFGGGKTPEEKLAIMRDSRIGTYGTVALLLTLMMKVGLISALGVAGGTWLVLAVLVASGAVSRAFVVAMQHLLPPARADGLGQTAGRPREATVIQAFVAALIILFLTVNPVTALPALLAGLAGGAILGAIGDRQIDGYTGDLLGACQQMSELAFLAMAYIVWTA